jgi:hypothetical protein
LLAHHPHSVLPFSAVASSMLSLTSQNVRLVQ